MADNRPVSSKDLEETNSESEDSDLEEGQTVIENEGSKVWISAKIHSTRAGLVFEKRSPGSKDKSEAIKHNCACTCRQAFRDFLRNSPTPASEQMIRRALDNHNCCSRHKENLDNI